ncbi:MAG: glycoside hydrolase family 44 protein, partial [Polyangiaceae bacterium]|nr:glycoside hydrolase family 44 protein [Polyangiaceae bacterium]
MAKSESVNKTDAVVSSPYRRWAFHAVVVSLAAAIGLGLLCRKSLGTSRAAPAVSVKQGPSSYEVGEVLFQAGLKNGWQDYGWCPRQLTTGGPAELRFPDWGGWIVARPGLQPGAWSALVFHIKTPAGFGDFLEVRVDSAEQNLFPRLSVTDAHRRALPNGWHEVLLPLTALNPEGLAFDRVVFRAHKRVGADPVLLDHIVFAKGSPLTVSSARQAVAARPAMMTVDCAAAAVPIHPTIYGIAFHFRHDSTDRHQWELGPAARRWGGNPTSRYNWSLGNAWNTGSDWYFENINLTGNPAFSYRNFLRDNDAHQVQSVLTVPLIGWVAKDTTSSSFPVSAFGDQQSVDAYRQGAGNGKTKSGEEIAPGPAARTSVPAPPEMIAQWIQAIRDEDKRTGKRSVHAYILDNEPMLWNSTHRDVHPDPVSYDELLDRTIRYGTAVRRADPDAIIAGPALWGWTAYFFSAKDAKLGYTLRPDRRMHGDKPLLPWYLEKLAAHERATGVRILDLVDVHFYPQAKRVGMNDGGTDRATAALRIRSTRALWDPAYVDESWIKESVRLIPRLKEWIAENYPG